MAAASAPLSFSVRRHITTQWFFKLALLLPVILGSVGWMLKPLISLSVALMFGGLAYLPFAVCMWLLIKPVTSIRQLIMLSAISPVIFGVWAGAVGTFSGWLDRSDIALLLGASYAVAGVVFGYFYVLLAWLLYGVSRKFGLVTETLERPATSVAR